MKNFLIGLLLFPFLPIIVLITVCVVFGKVARVTLGGLFK